MKPMRLKAVLRETWRNVATGTSRCALISLLLSICAVACMCADLTQMTGLIGDARKWKESGASTYAITLQGGIDGAACEGLRSANGVLGAAALRQSSDRVRIASLPATEIPTYEASAHVAQVFAATGIRKDNSGVIMSTAVARTGAVSRHLPGRHGAAARRRHTHARLRDVQLAKRRKATNIRLCDYLARQRYQGI